MNNAGQLHGEELGRMNPLSNNSFNYILNSANSLGAILYGHLEIGATPGCSSMVNSISQSRGMPGKSSGNTSRNSRTTEILSRLGGVRWWSGETITRGDERCRTVIP
jgi:hypothetical protein